jgi:hypothetical protein
MQCQYVPCPDQSATRDYPATLGRWMSPDALGGDITNPQSLNRYAYALNNPTSLTDPLGLQPDDCSDGFIPATDPECLPLPGCDEFEPFCTPPPPGPGGGGGGGVPPVPPPLPIPGPAQSGFPGNAGFPNADVYGPTLPLSLAQFLFPQIAIQCEFGACGGVTASLFVSDAAAVSGPCDPTNLSGEPCFNIFATSILSSQGKNIATLARGLNAITTPLQNAAVGGGLITVGGLTVAAGAGAIILGCSVGGPLGCIAGVMGGIPTMVGGGILVHTGYEWTINVTLPSLGVPAHKRCR